MYDPTVFENLKVAFENQIYDLDNIEQKITISNRLDRMDLSILARDFALEFTLIGKPDVAVEIVLKASLQDLSDEILERTSVNLGCSLFVKFKKQVHNVDVQCEQIDQILKNAWEDEIKIVQKISFIYQDESSTYFDNIEIEFLEKINEEHISDINTFLKQILKTLEELNCT
ncbi:hypothetical protein ACFSFY_08065 [Sporosarcina siberiensis]|uniref:Group-specific protein n=1 Tax=Sporosarcina siberiensis TaxID=1365606 RepID=A0ABW4SFB8_9BACL